MKKIKKIKKIKIKINGKIKSISENCRMSDLVKNLKIPMKKVAIELNHEIINKKNINKINLKKNDKIEIVHFIGGG
jgi:sulfur carrier protein